MTSPVLQVFPLGAPPWPTLDPFLFCVHHKDAYPQGDGRLGPKASLQGRNLGQDFAGKDGWNMYHGRKIPGFPQHPHRGFETVTVARSGYIDHADSMGATARYGRGDTQWMTAGKGVVHAEMFPLLEEAQDNPLELFQIWLNLPAEDKMVEPHFAMLWSDTIPRVTITDAQGLATQAVLVAGRWGDDVPPPPPPHSWAARPDADVAIWTLKLPAHGSVTLPAATAGSNRTLYFFRGDHLSVGSQRVPVSHGIRARPDQPLPLQAGDAEAEVLLLQGRPIGQPVVSYGPFVMNTRQEIEQAYTDYQRTRFGGWPWPSDDPVHARDAGRFARHADGRVERVG